MLGPSRHATLGDGDGDGDCDCDVSHGHDRASDAPITASRDAASRARSSSSSLQPTSTAVERGVGQRAEEPPQAEPAGAAGERGRGLAPAPAAPPPAPIEQVAIPRVGPAPAGPTHPPPRFSARSRSALSAWVRAWRDPTEDWLRRPLPRPPRRSSRSRSPGLDRRQPVQPTLHRDSARDRDPTSTEAAIRRPRKPRSDAHGSRDPTPTTDPTRWGRGPGASNPLDRTPSSWSRRRPRGPWRRAGRRGRDRRAPPPRRTA